MSTDSELIEYCLGLLDGRRREAVERRLAASPGLRAELRRTRETLTALAAAAPPRRPRAAVRERLLDALDDATGLYGFTGRLTVFLDLPAGRVRTLLDAAVGAPRSAGWRSGGVPGLSAYPFRGGANLAGADSRMLHLAAGASMPAHRHGGDEWGFVLRGDLREADGRRHSAGDIVHEPAGSLHRPFRAEGGPALLVVLLDGPVEWVAE